MAVYPESGLEPAAIFKAKSIYRDHQRRGFFRIGLLPLLVCDEVTFDIKDSEQAARSLAHARLQLCAHARGAPIELRRVAFQFPAETSPRLKALKVQIRDNGQWELQDVVFRSPVEAIQSSRATFQTTGPEAGKLTWLPPSGRGDAYLFQPLTPLATHRAHEGFQPPGHPPP